MATPFILDQFSEVHTPASCGSCVHWNASLTPTYATVGDRTLQVAQCLCRDDDRASYAEIRGPFEAAVFTHAENHCPAFEVHPGVAADHYAMAETYYSLDRELTRAAWA